MLTPHEVQTVKEDLERKGITMPGLDQDLLDHLLCSIEARMDEGVSFSKAYRCALHDLCGPEDILKIQQATIREINEGKSVLKNLSYYILFIGVLIGTFNIFATQVSPALILVCITLGIFFMYHAIFCGRKKYSLQSNVSLFKRTTWIPITGTFLFLVAEFKSYGLLSMTLWCTLIIAIAVPVYLWSIKRVLNMDSTLKTLLAHTLKLTTVTSLLWIPIALSVKLFRPDVSVFFFIDDFLLLAAGSFILMIGIQNLSHLQRHLVHKL
jgi:hypothetical protein